MSAHIMCWMPHLPLGLIDLLLQALQVGQEGLIELWQTDILLKTCQRLSETIHNMRTISINGMLRRIYLHEVHQLFLHTDNSNVLQFLVGDEEYFKSFRLF